MWIFNTFGGKYIVVFYLKKIKKGLILCGFNKNFNNHKTLWNYQTHVALIKELELAIAV